MGTIQKIVRAEQTAAEEHKHLPLRQALAALLERHLSVFEPVIARFAEQLAPGYDRSGIVKWDGDQLIQAVANVDVCQNLLATAKANAAETTLLSLCRYARHEALKGAQYPANCAGIAHLLHESTTSAWAIALETLEGFLPAEERSL